MLLYVWNCSRVLLIFAAAHFLNVLPLFSIDHCVWNFLIFMLKNVSINSIQSRKICRKHNSTKWYIDADDYFSKMRCITFVQCFHFSRIPNSCSRLIFTLLNSEYLYVNPSDQVIELLIYICIMQLVHLNGSMCVQYDNWWILLHSQLMVLSNFAVIFTISGFYIRQMKHSLPSTWYQTRK